MKTGDWHETDELHAEQGQADPFAAAVRATRMPMIITDPRQKDNPIVFVNTAFQAMTGYSRSDVIGRNCRLLQGPMTDRETVAKIRTAINERRDISVDILNYRRDGSTFWNGLYLCPVTNAAGEVQFFFASQLDVTDRVEAQIQVAKQREWLEQEVRRRTRDLEDAVRAKSMLVHEVDHRVKNNLQMISSLLAMQARKIKDPDARSSVESMLQRVESVGTVHRRLYQSKDVQQFDFADFIRDIASETMKVFGNGPVGLSLDLEAAMVPSSQASPLALIFNELMTNALKHGFPDGRSGHLTISVKRRGDQLCFSVADDGAGRGVGGADGQGFGTRLVRTLARQLQAHVEWRDLHPGTIAEVTLYLDQHQRENANG